MVATAKKIARRSFSVLSAAENGAWVLLILLLFAFALASVSHRNLEILPSYDALEDQTSSMSFSSGLGLIIVETDL